MHPSDDKNLKAALQQTPSEDGLPASIRQTILDAARAQAELNQVKQQPANTVAPQDSEDSSVILFRQRKAAAPVAKTGAAGSPKKRWTYGLATAALLVITVGLSKQLMQQSPQLPPQVATQQQAPAAAHPAPATTPAVNVAAGTAQPRQHQPASQPATDTLVHYSASNQAIPAGKPSGTMRHSRPDSGLSATIPHPASVATVENSYEAASYAGQPEAQADIEKTLQQVQHLQQSGQLGDAVGLLLELQKKYPQVQLPQSMYAILPVQETVTLSQVSGS